MSGDLREIVARVSAASGNRPLALFCDFDGTLTPIVSQPDAAFLPDSVRASLDILAERATVALVSGRSLDDLKARAHVRKAIMVGSHGYEIEGQGIPPAPVADPETAQRIARAAAALRQRLAGIEGALVEPKRFAVTAHWRHVRPELVAKVESAVDEVAVETGALRKSGGKMVFELRPALPWDKGRAVAWIIQHLGRPVLPVYVGDDVTDLDGLRAVSEGGIGIAVGDTLPADAAPFRLVDPGEVGSLLDLLARELPDTDGWPDQVGP